MSNIKLDRLYKKLGIEKGLTSIIGSGGKTTLIRRLAKELKADGFSVIVTPSTKIFIPDYCPLICNPAERGDDLRKYIEESGVVAVGRPILTKNGKVKLESSFTTFEHLVSLADFVLVEADGSKHLPLKAHADFEPVVPDCSNRTIMVAGLWGIGKPVCEVVHRPEIFSRIAGVHLNEIVTTEALARVINKENLCDLLYLTGSSDEISNSGLILAELVNKPVIWEEC